MSLFYIFISKGKERESPDELFERQKINRAVQDMGQLLGVDSTLVASAYIDIQTVSSLQIYLTHHPLQGTDHHIYEGPEAIIRA